MSCHSCTQKPVITLQHGNLCKTHFLRYFEQKVFKTINKFQLIGRQDKLCIATSGGKDSLTVLYLTKKYLEINHIPKNNLFALAIDEGIDNYRKKTLTDLEKFCKDHQIPLKTVSFEKEMGHKLDAVQKKTTKTPCNACGVWRRYLLNKYSRKFGATKIITGHNLDDEAQVTVMNFFKANTKLAGRLGPVSGIEEQDLFVQKVKPLYLCSEKEVKLYTFLQGWDVQFTECPYSNQGYRHQVQSMLNDFENKYKGTKQSIINSFLDLLPLLQERERGLTVKQCTLCNEAANQDICNACKIKEVMQNA